MCHNQQQLQRYAFQFALRLYLTLKSVCQNILFTLVQSGLHLYTLHLVAVCKLFSDATHVCVTAVTQLTQVSLAINVGGSTVCIHACVCALQEQKNNVRILTA